MKNFIKKHKTLLTICLLIIMTLYWIDSAKTAERERIAKEEIQKELAEEKKAKEENTVLMEMRGKLLAENEAMKNRKKEIDLDIETNLKTVEKLEHIVRCNRVNHFLEEKDDCKTNYMNYPEKVDLKK